MHIGSNRPAGLLPVRLSILILIGALALVWRVAAAGGLSDPVAFDIQPQRLSSALERFADQAAVQFTAPASLVGGLRTRGVHGRYAPTIALSKLLQHTGLFYRIVGPHTIAIISRTDPETGSLGMQGRYRVASAHRTTTRVAFTRDASTGSGAELPTIIVTAEKRAENVQTVPIAMDVLQGDELANRGVNSAGDIATMFPNISVQGASGINSGVTIRGVGTANPLPVSQQSVGQYFDGVSALTPFSSQLALFDLQRIEVLRGPQNVLFGRNTTGGAIRYISRTPHVGKRANGYARISAGNYSDVGFNAAYGFPLGATTAARLAVSVQHRRGIFTNLNNGERYDSISREAGRASFEWKPDDDTRVLVIAHVAASTGAPPPARAVGPTLVDGSTPCPTTMTGTNAYIGYNDCFQQSRTGALTNLSTAKWNDVYGVGPPIGAVHDAGGEVHVTHRFDDGIKLNTITGLEQTSVQYAEDFGVPFLQFESDMVGKYDSISQELRLESPTSGQFYWLAGVYASYEYDDLGTDVINNTAGPPTVPPVVVTTELKQLDRLASAYAKGDYRLTRRLTASVGGRFSYEDRSGTITPRSFNFTQNGTLTGAILPADSFISLPFAQSMVAGVTTPCKVGVRLCSGPGLPQMQITRLPGWNISLKYRFTAQVMGYLSDARGFKDGASDVRALAVFQGSALVPVKPEKLDSYETGVKATMFHQHMRLNADVFYYRWLDQQVFSNTKTSGPAFLNIPKSVVEGAELNGALSLPYRITFHGGAGYLNSRISDSGGLQGVRNGAPLSNVPRFTGDLTVGKGFELDSSGLLQLSATMRYQGREIDSLNDNPATVISAVTFLDLSGQYVFGSRGQYVLNFLAQNVTSAKTCGSNTFLPQGGKLGTYVCQAPNAGVPLYSLGFQMNFR